MGREDWRDSGWQMWGEGAGLGRRQASNPPALVGSRSTGPRPDVWLGREFALLTGSQVALLLLLLVRGQAQNRSSRWGSDGGAHS